MDKVVQQNAANAEESASASEQMCAQAEHMKELGGQLLILVEGQRKRIKAVTGSAHPNVRVREAEEKSRVKALTAPDYTGVDPEKIPPMGEDGFNAF